jgi:signal transduction histidine kinase
MNTILDVAEQLAAERNPIVLLDKVCSEARHLTLAQHAVVGLVSEEGSAGRVLHISGLDAAAKARLTPRSVGGGLLTTVLQERRPVRTQNPRGRPEALGLPAEHPALSSVLSVPIASSSRVYGWITLGNKLGTDEFSEVDERMAATLGALAGIAYEKAHLLHDLHRRLTALEHELHQSSARVREEERAQLSRTLHDQMGQTLVALKFDVHWLATQIASLPGASDTVTRKLDSMLERVDDAMKSVRTTAGELRPPVLDKLGLVAAIEWQAEEFERRSGIRCPVDSRIVESDLEPHWATAIFRIVQEALTNVLVHAHATRASIRIQRSVGSLTVSISDNGRGISDRALATGGSLGLLGMRERAAVLDGQVTVRRRKPAGTIVTVTVPFTRTGAARE